jgi:hypothetical protein
VKHIVFKLASGLQALQPLLLSEFIDVRASCRFRQVSQAVGDGQSAL